MNSDFFTPLFSSQTPSKLRYFDGTDWKDSMSGKYTDVMSPIDGSLVGSIPVVTKEEIESVIALAKKSQKEWELKPLHERVKVVHLAADWIREHEEYLTNLLMREIGKTSGDAKSEILRTADLIDYYADEAVSFKGETLDSDNFPGFEKGRIALVEKVAHGVILAIAPFNYPVNLSASKLAPALLMGNSVVFKPPTVGSVSALHLVQCFLKAGIPAGCLPTVTGGGTEIGDMLTTHPDISMIAFTGSSAVGQSIARKAGMIPLLFECGGNNPALVLPDADMGPTAREIIKGAFSYSGQRCTAIKYVMATKGVFDTLMPLLMQTLSEQVKMGDPRNPDTKMVGPVISEEAASKIEQTIQDAVAGGAVKLAGGKRNGTYMEPTLLSGVTPLMNIVKTETFGPVLSCIEISDMEEAIGIITASTYGLQACVFTKDEGTGMVIAKKINVGTVQINGSPQRGPDHFPFMGIKGSGVGVQGVHYSLEAMTRLKSTVINKPA